MHRKFVISGDLQVLGELSRALSPMPEIVTLSLSEHGSVKPPGGVLEVQALNRSADEVLRRLRNAAQHGRVVIEISESTSIIDITRQRLIDRDFDEMLWEEIEQDMRNEGRISLNGMLLMALGGSIAAAALVSPPSLQLAGFVAASIIAPGFSSIAALSLGVVLRRWHVVTGAVTSTVASYAIAVAAAMITFGALRALGAAGRGLDNQGVAETLFQGPPVLIMSVASAVAGALMIVSLRDIYVVGPLIGLMLLPASAIFGAALVAGRWSKAEQALQLMGMDAALIVLASAAIFWLKQHTVHRRRPLD